MQNILKLIRSYDKNELETKDKFIYFYKDQVDKTTWFPRLDKEKPIFEVYDCNHTLIYIDNIKFSGEVQGYSNQFSSEQYIRLQEEKIINDYYSSKCEIGQSIYPVQLHYQGRIHFHEAYIYAPIFDEDYGTAVHENKSTYLYTLQYQRSTVLKVHDTNNPSRKCTSEKFITVVDDLVEVRKLILNTVSVAVGWQEQRRDYDILDYYKRKPSSILRKCKYWREILYGDIFESKPLLLVGKSTRRSKAVKKYVQTQEERLKSTWEYVSTYWAYDRDLYLEEIVRKSLLPYREVSIRRGVKVKLPNCLKPFYTVQPAKTKKLRSGKRY